MKRFAVPLVVGLGVCAVVVWVVRSEGERYRRSVKNTAFETVDRAVNPPGDRAKDIATTTTDGAAKVLDNSKGSVEAPGKAAQTLVDKPLDSAGKIEPAGNNYTGPLGRLPDEPSNLRDSPMPTAEAVSAQLAKSPPAPVSKPRKPRSKQDITADPIESLFKAGQSITKTLDNATQEAFALNADEEIRYGRTVNGMVLRENKEWKAAVVRSRVEHLGKPILEKRARKNIPYSFILLDDPEVNAFSHLGGFVYINRGVIDLKPSDAELQFILGHEIAHVDLKHCVNQLTYTARASELAGEQAAQIVLLAYQMIALGYAEDKEFEADAWSFTTLQKLGRSKQECFAFLHRMLKLEEGRVGNIPNKLRDSAAERAAEQVFNHFRSHPPTEERVKRLEVLP